MRWDIKGAWLSNKYVRVIKHLTVCYLYWLYVMSDFDNTISRSGDSTWNRVFSNCVFIVILLSIYTLVYALKKSLPNRFYIFILVTLLVYVINCCFIYYSFVFIHGTTHSSAFIDLGYERMKDSFWLIPLSRFVDLYFWAISGNYIVNPMAILGIYNTFSYFNKNMALQRNNLELELDFLKAQINPHFLFNSLNNIYSLVEETNEAAASTVLKLSDLMRYSLYESNARSVPLSREIMFLRDYTALEKIRHTSDIRIDFEVDGDFDRYFIPPFILIPFVENAFKHGLGFIGNGWVEINIRMEGPQLILKVNNSKAPLPDLVERKKVGIGLINVKKRLDIYYPGSYHLEITNEASEYRVFLQIALS